METADPLWRPLMEAAERKRKRSDYILKTKFAVVLNFKMSSITFVTVVQLTKLYFKFLHYCHK